MTHVNIDEQRMRLVGPTARLVEFLRELARTGRPLVRSVDRHPVVRWLFDLPPELTLATEAGPGETVLSIDPVASEPPPPPPEELEPWLSRADMQDSTLDAPELADAIPGDARDGPSAATGHGSAAGRCGRRPTACSRPAARGTRSWRGRAGSSNSRTTSTSW
jgi:hypothetical protein